MSDELKKIFDRELDELKRNKIRVTALFICAAVLLIFWIGSDSSDGEKISLSEPTPVDVPATRDLPAKPLLVAKNPEGFTPVAGAVADDLFVDDPFATSEKSKPPPTPNAPPIPIHPPVNPKPSEKILLTGTAISGDVKTAMFLIGKKTLFLTIGDEIGGKTISDISPDCVTFADGVRIFVEKGFD